MMESGVYMCLPHALSIFWLTSQQPEVCPPGAVEEPPEVREVPVDGIVGAKTLDINAPWRRNSTASWRNFMLSCFARLHSFEYQRTDSKRLHISVSKVCLANPSNNFLVSFNGLLLSSTLSLHKSIPLEWCAHIQEQAEGVGRVILDNLYGNICERVY